MIKQKLLLLGILIFCLCSLVSAQGVELGGYLQTENRLLLKDNYKFSWQEYRLDLKADVKPKESAHFYSEIWIRSLGFPQIKNSADLVEREKISPVNLDFREAYLDIYGFILKNLDVRIGRQRIAWGTGDNINPTDNLNPSDLENLWDFGRHISSNGLKASYYLGEYTFSGAYIPIFTPAVLPEGDIASALFSSSSIILPNGLTLKGMSDTVVLPENNLSESSTFGIKIARSIFDYNLSISYVRGRDCLPLANKVIFIPVDTLGGINISSELMYPKMHIGGIDLAGELFSVGIWAESAIFFPEKIEMNTDLSRLGMGIHKSIALDDKPYIRYVIGADYTFKNGFYINGQYFHGFIHERGNENLGNYFMCAVEWKNSSESIRIIPIGIGGEVREFDDIKNNYAIIFMPEITYRPVDNAEIILGSRLIDGKSTTTFGKLKDNDEIYLKVKYSF